MLFRSELMTPIFLGSVLTWIVERKLGMVDADHDTKDRIHRKGVLYSAGLITGEALMGIFIAIPIVMSGKADVLALPEQLHFGKWTGLLLIGAVAWLLYRVASTPQPAAH